MNMSFQLTTEQIRNRSKRVTRRLGWWRRKGRTAPQLKVGQLLQPIVKGQGLKQGERVEKIGGLIRVVSVRRELLYQIDRRDVVLEGFAAMEPAAFVEMFCKHHRITPDTEVTRIEFEYVD